MLEMSHVTYTYKLKKKQKKVALSDVSLQCEPGVFYTIFGPSGSGKTTALSLMGGLDKPEQGEILIDGKRIGEIGENELRRGYVAYIFQDYQLFTYMTAVENVMTALQIADPRAKRHDLKKRAEEILFSLGLNAQEIRRRVTRLSGGQMQRVAIARALAVDARYILADEPTGNLDNAATEVIIGLLRELVEKWNKCVVVVTHSLRVREASDVCFTFCDGKLEETVQLQQNRMAEGQA